jgi:hypothetical protein
MDPHLGRPVGGDHDLPGGSVSGVVPDEHAASAQVGEHGLIVDQVTEDGKRSGTGGFLGQGDRIADAKAHSQFSCAEDFHAGRGGIAI